MVTAAVGPEPRRTRIGKQSGRLYPEPGSTEGRVVKGLLSGLGKQLDSQVDPVKAMVPFLVGLE